VSFHVHILVARKASRDSSLNFVDAPKMYPYTLATVCYLRFLTTVQSAESHRS
jgi:hypothetical protein